MQGSQLTVLDCTAGEYTLQFTPDQAAVECLPDYQTTITVSDPASAGLQTQIPDRCVELGGSVDLFAELTDATPGGSWRVASGNLDPTTVDPVTGIFATDAYPAGEYVFTYQAPEGFGCSGQEATVTVRLVAISVAGSLQPPDCEEACSGAITVNTPQPTWRYALNEEVPGSQVTFTDLCPGDYQLTARDDRGCAATTSFTVPDVVAPEVDVRGNLNLRQGDSTTIEVISNLELDTVTWSLPVKCLTNNCQTTVLKPLSSTVYRLTASSAFGCTATTEIEVRVDERLALYVPTAFSPNGDGRNDFLSIFAGLGVATVSDFSVYDRWGGAVAFFPTVRLNDEAFGWDGRTTDGRSSPPGVYVYACRVTKLDGEEEVVRGEIVLMR